LQDRERGARSGDQADAILKLLFKGGIVLAESKPLRREFMMTTGQTGFPKAEMDAALCRLRRTYERMHVGVHTVKDGQLITGQNPASSGPAAKLLIETLTGEIA
jgi:putative intracellular protease/amidase